MRPSKRRVWRSGRQRAVDIDHDDDHHHHEHDDEHHEHDDDNDGAGNHDDDVTGGAMTFHLALIGAGFVSFILAAANAPIPRVNLVALGLACVTLAQLL